MKEFQNIRRVLLSAEQMFDVVADIERYPEFVPLCTALTILERKQSAGKDVLIAQMEASYKAFKETFNCKVTLDKAARSVDVEYLSGPFKMLVNRWRFMDIKQPNTNASCDVDFYIAYEFKSFILQSLVGAMFDRVFHSYSEAFEQRAKHIANTINVL